MRALLRILLIILVPLGVAFGVIRFMNVVFLTPINASETTPVFFEIAPGRSFRAVAQDLEKAGLIRYWWSMEVLGRLKRGEAVINTGEYELSRSMNTVDIMQRLTSGETYKRRVTIREGLSMWNIGQLLDDAGLRAKSSFDKIIVDPQVIGNLGIQAQSLEGYLFPETYFFSRPITALQIVQKMVEESNRQWPEEYVRRAEAIGLSRHEVLTLASIIEKEAKISSEQPIISSVIHNRLKAGMKLQVDPTVIYGIPDFNGNLTKDDLERPSPYNTYRNYGLPPGPIANPGAGAIKAALFPSESAFIYFVADGTGGHVFSATLAEHNEAVRRFQIKK